MMRKVALGCAIVIAALWLNNTSLFVQGTGDLSPRILAHRGVHQTYAGTDLRDDTCTANPVAPITHRFIENTIPSMHAAFDQGAAVVELDIHLTPDGVFAVFHDWTLDCRTNGSGQTNETLFAVLSGLDAGYGYTADGQTFPLRGTGIGLVPSLTDVFETFPSRQFLINFKSNRASEGQAFLDLLAETETYRDQIFGIYGGGRPTGVVLEGAPDLRGFDWGSVRDCLIRYALTGWSGHVPARCHDTIIAVPINYAPFLWGWPYRFEDRMAQANTALILVGPYEGGRRINGIDTPEALAEVPPGFSGYVWTNDLPALEGAF